MTIKKAKPEKKIYIKVKLKEPIHSILIIYI